MKRTHRLDDKQRREILRLYAAGIPVHTIADLSGVGATYVSELAKRRGLPLRRSRSR